MIRDRDFYKTYLKLTVTLMLEQAVVLSVNLADNLMLGSYSETALSGVAAVNQIQFVLQQVVFAVSNGLLCLTSQYWGQKRTEPIKRLVKISLIWAAVLTGIFFVFVSAFPRTAVGIFTNDPYIIEEGMKYLSIVRFSYLFFALTTVLLGGMRSVEKVKIALYVSVLALVINCSINYTLIKGHFGFQEMGVRGAAIGTLTARIIECLVVIWYVLIKDTTLSFRLRDLLKSGKELGRDYARVSIPVIFAGLQWGINTAIQTVILGHLSNSAIAAHSISSTLYQFVKVMPVGSASAVAIIVGMAVGTGDMKRVRELSRTLQVIFVLIGVTLGALLFFIRKPFLSLYALSPETESLAETFIIIEATCMIFMTYEMSVNCGLIRGGGDTKYVMILDIIAIWGVVIPFSLLTAFVWKAAPVIVLIVLNIDQYLKCIPAAIYGNSYRWVRKLTRKEVSHDEISG